MKIRYSTASATAWYLLAGLVWATAYPGASAFGQASLLEPASVTALSHYGPVDTGAAASQTFRAAVEAITQNGGGVLLITPDTHPDFAPPSVAQERLGAPAITVLDVRGGKLRFVLPSLGFRIPEQPHGYSALFFDRQIKQDATNPDGANSILRMENDIVHGTSSYFQPVDEQESLPDPAMLRVYPSTASGLYEGQILDALMGVGQIDRGGEFNSTSRARVRVAQLGWDPDKQRHFADLRAESPNVAWGTILRLINKSSTTALYIGENRHSDGESFTVHIGKQQYGVGDNFGIAMLFQYMGNIMSTGGDERGNGYTVDTWHLLDSFQGTVEAWDLSTGELTYTPDSRRANTLGTSRPLINLNEAKWHTAGQAIVHSAYRLSGEVRSDEYVSGVDTSWSPEIVGRYFAIDMPIEYAGHAREGQRTFWRHALEGRSVRRWWRITHYEKTPEGEDRLWVERIRWNSYDRAAPTLMDPANYGKPLQYIIAPGALVTDVREGILQVRKMLVKGASLLAGPGDRRVIRLAPSSTTGTQLDFEPGDPVEQAVGQDPAHPNGYRVRHREAMPTTLPSASFLSTNNGAYPVYAGLRISGEHDQMHVEGQSKYVHGIDIAATVDYGIKVGNTTRKAALLLQDPVNRQPQPIVWKTAARSDSRLYADPQTGAIHLEGSAVHVSDGPLTGIAGISGTKEKSRNLRGINIPIPAGATKTFVRFGVEELDEHYALSVQPSWLTRAAVTEKQKDGFTVIFDGPAPEQVTIDWLLIR